VKPVEMDATAIQCLLFFLFGLLFCSGSSMQHKFPSKAIKQERNLNHQESQTFLATSKFITQLDSSTGANVPIINPTPTTTPTPIVNPSPPPPAPTTNTEPSTNPGTTTPTTSTGAWCIASPTASQTALQVALDYACGYGGADCSAIQTGASCYNPNTVRDHASYAFNDYYQKNPIPTSCVFGGTAQLSYTDPSSGNCHYASPSATTSTTPTTPTTTSPPSPTTTTTPTGTYGFEPVGSPSLAISIRCNLLLLFAASLLFVSSLAANFF
ncbi:X8 domain, partial [Dillenia turbinata]